MKVISSILEAIGNTPLLELARITRGLPGRILLKLDYLNPGFSKKDRAALGIIEEAERSAALRPGQTVVELTSGNMGTGLAIVCAVKGYPFVAVMSRGNSAERAHMMRALGVRSCWWIRRPAARPDKYPVETSNSWKRVPRKSPLNAQLSEPTSLSAMATGALMRKRRVPKSSNKQGGWMHSAILSAQVARFVAAPRPFALQTPTFVATSWSPQAQPCWRDGPPSG